MKRFRKLMSMLMALAMSVSALMTLGGVVPVAAAETDVSDEWSAIKDKGYIKTVITDESFGDDFVLAPEGTLKNGVWERIGTEGTVTVENGNVVIVPPPLTDDDILTYDTVAETTGIRFKYPTRDGITVYAVTAKRHDSRDYHNLATEGNDEYNSRNKLKLNVRYDAKNRYSYQSKTSGGTSTYVGMDPAREKTDCTGFSEDTDYSRTVTGYFMVQTGDTKVRKKYLNGETWNDWYQRTAVQEPDGAESKWDTLELYSNGAQFEIESVKIINYAPKGGKCYFNEGFEDMGADASLTGAELAAKLGDRGVTFYSGSTLPQTDLSIGTADGSSYLQLGTDVDRTKNAMAQVTSVKIPSLTELDNSTSEFYVRMKLKTAATTEEITNENVTYMYIQFGKSRFVVENKRMGGIKVDNKGQYVTYTNDEELVKQDVWTTAEFHIKGGKASLTITREGGEPVEICEGAGPEAQSSAKYQVYIYGARLCIEDLQIYTPGYAYGSLQVQEFTDNGTNATVTLYNSSPEKKIEFGNAKLLLGGYNMDFLQDVQLADVSDSLEPLETKTVTVPSLNTAKKMTERKLFLWDGFTNLIPLMQEPYYCF